MTAPELDGDRRLLAEIREHGLDADESGCWLGRYVPIRNGIPGQIILHRQNLARLICCARTDLEILGYAPDAEIQQALPYYLIWATYAHEQFHFICDIARTDSSSQAAPKDGLLEEALATAWGRRFMLCVGTGTPGIGALVDWKFNSISAPGYRDWKQYNTPGALPKAIQKYLGYSTQYLNYTLVPTAQAASWCNYWIGGDFPLLGRAPGRRGDRGFFAPELHECVLQ